MAETLAGAEVTEAGGWQFGDAEVTSPFYHAEKPWGEPASCLLAWRCAVRFRSALWWASHLIHRQLKKSTREETFLGSVVQIIPEKRVV